MCGPGVSAISIFPGQQSCGAFCLFNVFHPRFLWSLAGCSFCDVSFGAAWGWVIRVSSLKEPSQKLLEIWSLGDMEAVPSPFLLRHNYYEGRRSQGLFYLQLSWLKIEVTLNANEEERDFLTELVVRMIGVLTESKLGLRAWLCLKNL